MSKEINEMLNQSLQNLNLLVDSSKVVGSPIKVDDNRVIIPLSKISFGFGSGGSEFGPPKGKVIANNLINDEPEFPFGGGTVGGVNISPIAFIIIDQNNCQILKVEKNDTLFEQIFKFVIEILKKSNKKTKD